MIKPKLYQFRAQIRRKEIQKQRSIFRKIAQYNPFTIQDVAKIINFPPEQHIYNMKTLLQFIHQKIIQVPVQTRMFQNPNLYLPIQNHIIFWRFYSEQLQQDPQLFSQSLQNALLQIISKYSYLQIHSNTNYEFYLMNCLMLTVCQMASKSVDLILQWISGTQGLRVIKACVDNIPHKSYVYREYPKIFKIIQLGLKSQLKQDGLQATYILNQIAIKNDWDDNFQIYQKANGIVLYLCQKIQRYYQTQSCKIYYDCILNLLQTYQRARIDYTKGGLGYIAAILCLSQIQINVIGGLNILVSVCSTQSSQLINFLLTNNDILNTQLWTKFSKNQYFIHNEKQIIKANYYVIIANLLSSASKRQIQIFCQFFQSDFFNNILQMFIQELPKVSRECQDYILHSIQSLLYYQNNSQERYLQRQLITNGIMSILQKISIQSQTPQGTKAIQILQRLNQNNNNFI